MVKVQSVLNTGWVQRLPQQLGARAAGRAKGIMSRAFITQQPSEPPERMIVLATLQPGEFHRQKPSLSRCFLTARSAALSRAFCTIDGAGFRLE
jgi:hypothetical protein